MDAVTDELVVHCQVVNKFSDTIVVTPILEVPDAIIVGARATKVQHDNESTAIVKESFDLGSGESQDVTFELPPLGWRDALGLLFYRYGARELRFRVRYQITPPVVEHYQPQALTVITPQAPLLGVGIGLLLGVLVTVAFVIVHRRVKGLPAMGLREAGANALLGSITVVMAAVLFRYASVSLPQLPLSVSVRDFIGGIMLGVFFQPLVDWFAKLVLADTGSRSRREDTNTKTRPKDLRA
jgi:hypothetical protein